MLPVCKERWLITTYKVKVRYFADLFQKVWFQILLKVPRGVKASALHITIHYSRRVENIAPTFGQQEMKFKVLPLCVVWPRPILSGVKMFA